MFSVVISINGQNIKKWECNNVIPPVLEKYRSLICDFKSISSCLQQRLLIIIETSKIQSRMVNSYF